MKLQNRIIVCAALTAIAAALLAFTPAPAQAQSGTRIDGIVAWVGGEIITLSELDMQMIRLALRSRIDVNDKDLRRRVLDDMISRKLILAQAELDSVTVSEEQVTAQLEEQIRMYTQNYGSVQKLEEAAGMTVAQMKREFRDDIRKNLMIENLQRERIGPVSVTNREVEEFFRVYKDSLPQVPEQVQLRQITVFPRVLDVFKDAARAKAVSILDSLTGGADFAELARRNSDDPGSAVKGGDLGEARRGFFVRDFEEAVFALKPGETSGIVETEFGFHIIRLLERRGELVRPAHILVRVQKTGESDEAAKLVLKDLRARILAGEDFAAVAKEHSQDVISRSAGGDMGLLEVGQLGDEMRVIQQNLEPGQMCEPTRVTVGTEYAFLIVRLESRIPPHAPTLKDDYSRIAGYARIFKQNKLYTDWIESIKGSVTWKVNL